MSILTSARRWTRNHSIAELCRRCAIGPRSADMHQIQKWLKGSRKTLPNRLMSQIELFLAEKN